jgi:phospholipid-binding lipoprotein MlaA
LKKARVVKDKDKDKDGGLVELEITHVKKILIATLLLSMVGATGALAAGPMDQSTDQSMGQPTSEAYSDPFAPFNEKMFWFNLKLDKYLLRPVAGGYADVLPEVVRVHIGDFWDNVGVIPRFANNLFQLKFTHAGSEAGRFLINSTLGGAGFFDVADPWFGLKEYDEDFGLTLGHYGVPMGPYLVLPFYGPSSVRDTIGRAADGSMNPMNYTLSFWVSFAAEAGATAASAVNYRSLNLQLFEDVDRYAVDLYGAVQDGYIQRRKKKAGETTF